MEVSSVKMRAHSVQRTLLFCMLVSKCANRFIHTYRYNQFQSCAVLCIVNKAFTTIEGPANRINA